MVTANPPVRQTISVVMGPLIHSLLQAKIQEYLSPPAGQAVCSWLRCWGEPGKQRGALGNSQELKGAGRDLKIPSSLQVPCWAGARRRKNMALTLRRCFLAFCACPHLAARGIWNSTCRCFPSSCHSLLAQPPLLFPDPVLCSRHYFVLFRFCPSQPLIKV